MRPALLAFALLAFAGDALAWGLQTHVFFAQHLLLVLPLLDPELRRAALRFPRLVLAGACLPDLALAGAATGIRVFRRNHQWPSLRRLAAAGCDEERAVALGYASHLLADIVAHNRFVPDHERRLADVAHVTHALCEWAMDDYLKPWVCAAPGELLATQRKPLAEIVALRWRCGEPLALRLIDWLTGADRLLRRARVPRFALALLRFVDRRLAPRFDAYVRETSVMLAQVGAVLEGREPAADPEPSRADSSWRAGQALPQARR